MQGKHPAIISDEMFERAQELFCGNVPLSLKRTITNPFASLIKCADCGKTFCYRAFEGKTARPRLVHPHSVICKTKSAKFSVVFDLVCQGLKEYIHDFNFKLTNAGRTDEIEKHVAEIATLEKELENAKKKRRRLFDDYDDGVYTPEEFKERKLVWAERIEFMTAELEKLNAHKPAEVDYKEKLVKFTQALEALQDPNVSPKIKNDLLKDILKRIDYSCEDYGRNKGGKVTIDLILKD